MTGQVDGKMPERSRRKQAIRTGPWTVQTRQGRCKVEADKLIEDFINGHSAESSGLVACTSFGDETEECKLCEPNLTWAGESQSGVTHNNANFMGGVSNEDLESERFWMELPVVHRYPSRELARPREWERSSCAKVPSRLTRLGL